MKSIFAVRLLALLTTLVASTGIQAATNFTPAQTTQIEGIVHNYLVTHPEVLLESAHALQQKQQSHMQQQAQDAIAAHTQQLFATGASPVVGNPHGDITLIEFFDFQCPYCKRMAPMFADLIKQDPNVRIVFKQLPIFGDESECAARAALAAAQQGNKYFAFHNALMKASIPFTHSEILDVAKSVGLDVKKLQADMNNSNITQELKTNEDLANDLGLVGTPAFIVAKVAVTDHSVTKPTDSIFIPGAVTQKILEQAIQQARQG